MANLKNPKRQKQQPIKDFSQLANVPAVNVTNDGDNTVITPKEAHYNPNEPFMYVTDHKLRRTVIKGDVKHAKLVMPMDMFRRLTAIGMNNGVTWDEVLRAAIDREFSGMEPFKDALEFLPLPAASATEAA